MAEQLSYYKNRVQKEKERLYTHIYARKGFLVSSNKGKQWALGFMGIKSLTA